MGENLGDAAAGESEDAAQRRAKLMQAVEGDNWSAVIDAQTKATIDPATRPAGAFLAALELGSCCYTVHLVASAWCGRRSALPAMHP